MRIVLFGQDIFTATALRALLDNGHEVVAVIGPAPQGPPAAAQPPNTSNPPGGLQHLSAQNNIPFHAFADINSSAVRDIVAAANPALLVSVHLKKILQKEIFSCAEKGAINVHPSLLPRYRGLSPQHQALLHGDKETGVTIHYITEQVDRGDILLQETIPLDRDTYIYDLQVKMLSIYKRLLPTAVALIGTGAVSSTRQEESAASWYGPLTVAERKIELKKSTFEIYNLIRSVSKPYKGAWYENITVWRAEEADAATAATLAPKHKTEGLYPLEDRLLIRLKDGILLSDDFEISSI